MSEEGTKITGLVPGVNYTVDFIFYDDHYNVLLAPNEKITGLTWALIGTFSPDGNANLTDDQAKDLAYKKLKLTGDSSILDGMVGNKNLRDYSITNDNRLENCNPPCTITTQVFTLKVIGEYNKEKIKAGIPGSKWLNWSDEKAKTFIDHRKLIDRFFAQGISGGRRTRRRKGKKSKKSKKRTHRRKSKKGRKTRTAL